MNRTPRQFSAEDAVHSEVRPFPLNPLYEVCSEGRVRRVGSRAWLTPCVLKRGGYLAVNLFEDGRGRTWTVHRIVAITFLGAPTDGKTDVAHADGDKRNNRVENLRWATRAENEADKVLHGRSNRGERNGQSKLTDEQARYIRERCKNGRRGTQARLAEQFGITSSAVSNIANGKRWSL